MALYGAAFFADYALLFLPEDSFFADITIILL